MLEILFNNAFFRIIITLNAMFFLWSCLLVAVESILKRGRNNSSGCTCKHKWFYDELDVECPVHGYLEEDDA